MAKSPDAFSTAVRELTTLVDHLRSELREALEAVIPVLDGARACGRALGLKRGLGWKIYAVATSSELPEAIAALPREAGWRLVFASLRKARCPATKLAALEKAVATLQDRLESGDFRRPMLRAIAAGQLDSPRETASLLMARRAVREGNEEICGIRCRSRLGFYAIGAADGEGRISLATCSIKDGLRRLRPGPPVAIKSLSRAWHPQWEEDKYARPLGTSARSGWLVADLSTPGVWEDHLEIRDGSRGPIVYFEETATEADRAVRTVFAEFMKHAGTTGHADDRVDIHFGVSLPTAHCAFEAWIHRSLVLKTEPSASLAASLELVPARESEGDLVPLPLETRAERLEAPALPASLRAIARTHREMLSRAAAALDATVDDFVGYRVAVPDPPIGARIRLRWRM